MSSKTKRLGTLADIYQKERLDGTITRIKLGKIAPSSEQPRRDRTMGVDELAESIKRDGLLSPIVVTRSGADTYRIIAGERRYHALKKLGWQEAECRIISREERDYWRISIIENLQRENLSPEEEAAALARLKKQEDLSDAGLAQMVGKSRNYITEILGIAQLPEEVLAQCREAGIDNRNLLIQVVQAFRKDSLPAFLAAYRAGQIRTVRSAREFNQGGASPTIEEPGAGTQAAPRSQSERRAGPARVLPQMELRGAELLLRCQSPAEAQALQAWIQRRYPDDRG